MRLSLAGLIPAAASVIFLAAGACAQDFKITTPLVLVPATVTGRDGKTVDGLNAADFTLLDNGALQQLSLEYTLSPVSLVLVVEANKRSSGPVLKKLQKVGSLFQPLVLGLGGSAAVVTFADRIRVAQDFTTRPEILGDCLRRLEPQGDGVRMHDAVSKAVDMLAGRRGRERRKVVIVVSGSKDRVSQTKLDDLVTRAQAANIVIYSLTYSALAPAGEAAQRDAGVGGYRAIVAELAAAAKDDSLAPLAKFTGGVQLRFSKLDELERMIQRIAQDLHSQYLLSFSPSSIAGDSGFHRLEVRLKDHPEAVVIRTRPAYWTPSQ